MVQITRLFNSLCIAICRISHNVVRVEREVGIWLEKNAFMLMHYRYEVLQGGGNELTII